LVLSIAYEVLLLIQTIPPWLSQCFDDIHAILPPVITTFLRKYMPMMKRVMPQSHCLLWPKTSFVGWQFKKKL